MKILLKILCLIFATAAKGFFLVGCDAIDFITGHIEPNNCYLPVSGVYDAAYLFNLDDLDGNPTEDPTNELIITNLDLKAGKYLYKLTGRNKSNKPNYKAAHNAQGQTMYEHYFDFLGLDLSPEAFKKYEQLANAKLCIIAKYRYQGEDGIASWHMFGLTGGMVELEQTQAPSEDKPAVSFKFGYDKDRSDLNTHTPESLWVNASLDDTEAFLESLVSPY